MFICKASDNIIPYLTACLFTTGITPGYPKSYATVSVLGICPKVTGPRENIFDLVFNSTWISIPITG